MYFSTIIFAALSAGAFADNTHTIFLTAFAPQDTHCTGHPVGNNVTVTTPFLVPPFDPKTTPGVKGPCMVYAPGSGQNIQVEYSNDSFSLTAYSEPNCQDEVAQFMGQSYESSYCVGMNQPQKVAAKNAGSNWQSIQLAPVYNGALMPPA